MNLDKREVNCKEIVENLYLFSKWCRQVVEYNGSSEVDEECNPLFKNYNDTTLEAFSSASEIAKCLAIISANLFMLHNDDLSEDRLFSEIERNCNELDIMNVLDFEEGEE